MGTLIRGGTVVTADLTTSADVYCDDGKIKQVGPDLAAPEGAQVLDAGGCYVMPGGIDPHTHLELPFMGTRTADDWYTGTVAALTGGTTTIIDFVIPDKGGSLLEAIKVWEERSEKAACDFAYHMAVTWWGDQVRKDMETATKEKGITSYKFFMAYKGYLMVTDEELIAGFTRCRELGAVAAVHAENGDMVHYLQQQVLAQGIKGPEGHPQTRPPECEGEAAARAIRLAEMLGTPLYIVHVGAKEAAAAIRGARLRGQRVFGETLPGFLAIDDSVYYNKDWEFAASHVMSPCFKPKGHPEFLMKMLQAGMLQTTGTDHCTFNVEQKRMGIEDFSKIPNGTGAVEDRMPVLWQLGVNSGRLSVNEFVAATSTNAAKIFNMYPRKGAILPGSDADITVWDPEKIKTISAKNHYQANDFNVFEGMEVKGLPVHVLAGGRHVWKDGEVQAERGAGQYVPRKPFGPAYAGMDIRQRVGAFRKVERHS
ncbi:dihydropyrimidinase [Planctomycetota bacterium]